MIANYEKKV